MPKKSTISQARYDQAHCRTYGLKLNTGTDADIIEKLASVPSMQGYIKALVRADINGSVPESAPDSKPVPDSVPKNAMSIDELYSWLQGYANENYDGDLYSVINKLSSKLMGYEIDE